MASKRILVVEPIQSEWDFIRDIFDLRGDEAYWAKTEGEAFELFGEEEFNLVLIEALMPRMSGYEICSRLTKMKSDVPVLMMGAVLRNFNLAHEARIKHGASDVLVKPFDAFDLEKKLSWYLDGVVLEKDKSDQMGIGKGGHTADPLLNRGGFRLSGRLEKTSIPSLIAACWHLGEDGILHVSSGQVQKNLFFLNKKVVMVTGGGRHETLQHVLQEQSLIDEDTFSASLDKMLDTGKPQGEVLIEMGAITPHQLYQMLQIQAERKILDLFSWDEGKYRFEPAVNFLPDDAILLPLDLGMILRSGVGEVCGVTELNQLFEGKINLAAYKIDKGVDRFQHFKPNTQERKLWEMINGKNTVSVLLGKSEMDPVNTLRFLYLLLIVDAMTLAAPAKEGELKVKPAIDPLSRSDNEEDVRYREFIKQRFTEIRQSDLLKVFDLPPGSDPEQIKQAYLEACAGLQDERLFQQADEMTRAKAEAIFNELNDAYEILIDPEHLELYYQARQERASLTDNSLLESELQFQKGLDAFRNQDYVVATDFFQAAIEIHNRTPEYHAYLGYALYLKDDERSPMSQSLAIDRLHKALTINKHVPETYLFLGHIYRDSHKLDKAREKYEKAYESDDRNLQALTALREIYAADKAEIMGLDELEVDEEMREYERTISEFYQRMGALDHYAVLGLDPGSEGKSLRQAYFRLSAQYRPSNMYVKASDIVKEKADEIFNRLTVAYTTLSDRDSRNRYDQELMGGDHDRKEEQTVDEAQREEALQLYQQGKQHIEKKEYKQALQYFGKAHKIDPYNARNLAWLGYMLFVTAGSSSQSDHALRASAKEHLRQALTIDSMNVDASILLGRIYFSEKKMTLAEEQFDQALAIAPDNIEALQGYVEIFADFKMGSDREQAEEKDDGHTPLTSQFAHELESLREQNLFDRLDLSRLATEDEIRQAFVNLIDRFSNEQQIARDVEPAAIAVLDEMIDLVTEAYKVLSNENLREGYLRALGSYRDDGGKKAAPPKPPEQEEVLDDIPSAHEPETVAQPAEKTEEDGQQIWDKLRSKFKKK